jgi:signal transduction histidine kinase
MAAFMASGRSGLVRMPLSRRLVLYTVLILVTLHGANAIFITELVRSAEETATSARHTRATLLAEHAARSIGAIDMALEQIAKAAATDPDLGRKSVLLHMALHSAAARLPQVRAMTILDKDGVQIQDSRHYPAATLSFAHYPDFAEQIKWRGVGLFIDTPRTSKIDGHTHFALSRPIVDSSGNIRGVVVALAEPIYFMTFYGSDGTAALARDDGIVLAGVASQSNGEAVLGTNVAGFLRRNPDFVSVSQPVGGLPLQILVMGPPTWMDPSFRTYATADAVFMAMLTLLAAIATTMLVKEARAREVADQRLLDAIESVPAGFALFDASERFEMCNDAYKDLFGIAGQIAPSMQFDDILRTAVASDGSCPGRTADDHVAGRSAAVVRPRSGDVVQQLPDGRWILTRWRGTKNAGIVCFHTDISRVKQQEEALREAHVAEKALRERAEAADRAKSVFLATMSHELRTPLNAVIGFSEVIERETFGPVAPRYREYSGLILKSGRHLLKIINDMLDIAKLQSGKTELRLEAVDAASSMDEAATILSGQAKEMGVSLRCEPDPDLPRVQADPTRLDQILINLVSNAVKYTPSGGSVTMQAYRAPQGLTIEIADTGIGIAAEDLPMVLEPFGRVATAMTNPREGTGLGLPLAKNLVELHGGVFEIESLPGRGTTVRVTLPCAPSLTAQPTPLSKETPSPERSVA